MAPPPEAFVENQAPTDPEQEPAEEAVVIETAAAEAAGPDAATETIEAEAGEATEIIETEATEVLEADETKTAGTDEAEEPANTK